MKRTWHVMAFSAALSAALFAGAAPARAEEHDWTGAYVGADLGAGMSSGHIDDPDCFNCVNTSFNERLLQVGVNAGYDKQFNTLVLGVGAEMNLGSQHHVAKQSLDDSPAGGQDTMSKIDWTGALTARAGLAVQNSLFYLTAGPALAHVSGFATHNGTNYRAAFNSWQPGLKTGAGLEFMVTPRVSFRAQVSMLNVASRTAIGRITPPTSARTVWSNAQSAATVGAAWHF